MNYYMNDGYLIECGEQDATFVLYDDYKQLQARIEELEAHIKTASRAGFIAGVKWYQTETGYKSLNTAVDEYSAGKPL